MTDPGRDDGRPAAERFVTFADAVVAIAITLLAIPLLEQAGEVGTDIGEWWASAQFRLLGLAISFAVIGRLWWSHHRVFEHVRRLSGVLVLTVFAWLLSIVLLSVATSISTSIPPGAERGSATWPFEVYVGTIILSSALLTAQAVIVWRRPGLTDGQDAGARGRAIGSAEVTVGFVVVLLIGSLLPQVNFLAFFVLVLTGRLSRLVNRRLDRRAAAA